MQLSTNKFFNLKTIASHLKVTKPLGFALTVSTLLFPSHVFALGIRVPDQDAAAIARGNAFVATADNPSAIFYNPAGITQLDGINSRSGIYGIYLNDHYENDSGASVNTKHKLQPVPQFFLTATCPNHPLSFGLGVYSPYGLGMEWHQNAPFLNAPSGFNVPQKGQMQYITVNPVVAYKPIKTLSIAAGLSYNHAESELLFRPFGVDYARFRGRDDDIGYNFGILWQPLEQHSFGITYRSETTMDLTGHSDTHFVAGLPFPFPVNVSGRNAQTVFKFPQTIVAGYSFRPNTNWNFEFDADWTDWHRLKNLTLADANTGAQLQSLPLNWQSSWMFELGVTRYLANNWRLSGGYMFSQDSTPSAHFNPIIPDSNRHIFSVGVGKRYKRMSWDATYQLSYGPERTISGEPGINGTYQFISHALAVSMGYHF
jgi:long-chain fatty acid transport protein